MSEADPHAPTHAGPVPDAGAEPTPVVPPEEADHRTPPGTAWTPPADGGSPPPEVLAATAFAGGIAVAVILRLLTRGRR